MQVPGARAISELCRPKDVETLIVPSDPATKTYIPFGMDGTSVIISPYGEILRMSRYLDEEEPRIICLGSPTLEGYHRDLVSVGFRLHELAQTRETGLQIRLLPTSGDDMSSMKTRLEWINGHWPCIYYELDGLDVSVLFTVDEGILSQQYLIANPSAEQRSFRFALQIGGAQVNTLHVEGYRWCGANDIWTDEIRNLPHTNHAFHVAEKQWEETTKTTQRGSDTASITRGEAVIAVFHNDELLAPENAFQIPVSRNDFDNDGGGSDDEPRIGNNASSASDLLDFASCGVQKLVVQYSLRPNGAGLGDSQLPLPRDISALLKNERSGNWSFVKDDIFNPIFRRHLEYILCLCLNETRPNSEQQLCNPFINDITFESGSTAINDL